MQLVVTRALAVGAAVTAMAVSVVVLTGYAVDGAALTQGQAGLPAMAPGSAVAAALAAVAVVVAATARGSAARWAVRALALFVVASGLAAIVEYITDAELGVELFLSGGLGNRRPTLPSALGLTLVGAALGVIDVKRPAARVHPAEACALLVLLFTSVALGAYIYAGAAREELVFQPSLTMSLPSAAALALLGVGVLAARPERGFAGLVTSRLIGGHAARRLTLAALAVPATAMIVAAGERAGLWSEPATASLIATSAFSITVFLVFNTASVLNRIDLDRRRGEDELRRSREALRVSEERTRRLFEDAAEPIVVSDSAGVISEVNQATVEILEVPREQIIGKRATDFVPSAQASAIEAMVARLRSGATNVDEWVLQRSDGAHVLEVRSARLSDGRWESFAHDVTEQRRAAAEVARSRAWLSAVLDQMPEAAVIYRRDGGAEVVEVNNAALCFASDAAQRSTDTAKAEALRTIFEVLRPSGEPLALEELPIMRALSGDAALGDELLIVAADGSRYPVLASASAVRDGDGEVLGAVALYRDITPLKEIERLREEWTSVVAHDLRQPISVLQLSTSALEHQDLDDAGRRCLERLRASTRSLRRMIDDLLDASRIEAKRMTLQPAEHDVAAMVREIVERQAELTQGHAVLVSTSDGVGAAHVDAGRMEQVLANLLSNAVKYGDAGADIEVVVSGDADSVTFAVTNRGPPIPDDEMQHLFERFNRLHPAEHTGVGIGLYVVKGLVEAHGGRVSAESADGRTTFRFTLPRA